MNVANRTIWTLWYQGFADAPPLVHACLDSWRRFNPGWQVVALDRDNLHDWIALREVVELGRSDLPVQKIAAVARLCLLRRYGGVWTDATVFCMRRLDEWLADQHVVGFTVFRNPGPDRLMSNWFIAAEKDSALLVALHDAFLAFINSRRFANQNNAFGRRILALLQPVLEKDVRRTTLWLNPWLQRVVRVYPYFIFHYTFNKLVLTRPDLRLLWERAPPLEAGPVHLLQALAHRPDGLPSALEHIDRDAWVMQKLDWRVDVGSSYWSAVMRRLVEHVHVRAPVRQSDAP